MTRAMFNEFIAKNIAFTQFYTYMIKYYLKFTLIINQRGVIFIAKINK